jgi:hypothetical protein
VVGVAAGAAMASQNATERQPQPEQQQADFGASQCPLMALNLKNSRAQKQGFDIRRRIFRQKNSKFLVSRKE